MMTSQQARCKSRKEAERDVETNVSGVTNDRLWEVRGAGRKGLFTRFTLIYRVKGLVNCSRRRELSFFKLCKKHYFRVRINQNTFELGSVLFGLRQPLSV